MTILPIIAGDLSDPKDFDIREVYELINNGSVDTLATSFQYTEARSRQFSFTNPIYKVIISLNILIINL
jgi:ABC-type amino acid transport substrate-binding protein